MTRVAIIANSEHLRSALAAALRAHPAFEIVATGASLEEVVTPADVVLVAEPGTISSSAGRSVAGDSVGGTPLSNREREILALLADGLTNKEIAARLGIATNTVKTHMELLFERLDASSRAEAVAIGVKRGLLFL